MKFIRSKSAEQETNRKKHKNSNTQTNINDTTKNKINELPKVLWKGYIYLPNIISDHCIPNNFQTLSLFWYSWEFSSLPRDATQSPLMPW